MRQEPLSIRALALCCFPLHSMIEIMKGMDLGDGGMLLNDICNRANDGFVIKVARVFPIFAESNLIQYSI